MSLTALLVHTVTVVRLDPGAADRYGDRAPAETSRRTTSAWLQQNDGTEATRDRQTVTTDWLLVLPADVGIDAGDRVEAEGRVFEVAGPPSRVRTPAGFHHVEARLRHVEG